MLWVLAFLRVEVDSCGVHPVVMVRREAQANLAGALCEKSNKLGGNT